MNYYLDEYLPCASNSPALVPDAVAIQGGAAVADWVPVEKVVGEQKSKALEDCNDETGECRIVVEAAGAAEKEQALTVCDVIRVGDETGPGRNCEAVALIAPRHYWIVIQSASGDGDGSSRVRPAAWDAARRSKLRSEAGAAKMRSSCAPVRKLMDTLSLTHGHRLPTRDGRALESKRTSHTNQAHVLVLSLVKSAR